MSFKILSITIVLALSTLLFLDVVRLNRGGDVVDFETCVEEGFIHVTDSYPERCIIADGTVFEKSTLSEVGTRALISVREPTYTSTVESPVSVIGLARADWFDGGTFPVTIQIGDRIIAAGTAEAFGDWESDPMQFIPFRAHIAFEVNGRETADIVLRRGSASTLPEFENVLHIPVYLKGAPLPVATSTEVPPQSFASSSTALDFEE